MQIIRVFLWPFFHNSAIYVRNLYLPALRFLHSRVKHPTEIFGLISRIKRCINQKYFGTIVITQMLFLKTKKPLCPARAELLCVLWKPLIISENDPDPVLPMRLRNSGIRNWYKKIFKNLLSRKKANFGTLKYFFK